MGSDIYSRVGARIQDLRKTHGLTQNDLAEKADVGVSYLVKLEGGVRKARLEVLERLAGAMNEPLWRIFGESRFSTHEKRWRADATKLAETLPELSTDDVRALTAVAQQLAERRKA